MNPNVMRAGTTQAVAISGTSAPTTNAVGSQTRVVRLIHNGSAKCHVAFAGTPTATTSDMMLAPNREEYFSINPGEKVAGIGTDGNLYVTEMSY